MLAYFRSLLLFITKVHYKLLTFVHYKDLRSWCSLGQKKMGSIFSWKGSLCCQDAFCRRDVRAWRDQGAVAGQKSCCRGCWDSAQLSALKLKRSLLPGVLAGIAHSSAPPQSLSWLMGATSPKTLRPSLRVIPTPEPAVGSVQPPEEVLIPKLYPINNLHSNLHLTPYGQTQDISPKQKQESWDTGEGSWKRSRLKGRIFISWSG